MGMKSCGWVSLLTQKTRTMPVMNFSRGIIALCFMLFQAGCSAGFEEDEHVGRLESNLTAAQRRVRAGLIRDASDEVGVYNGLLLAGVANNETGMSQCWSELTWACQGPYSADCQGPVVAGAGDGPCELEQGGLGMFQFDGGTYAMTLEREGDRILSIAGNVQAGIDFIVSMVKRSMYIPDVSTDEEAIAWINAVRPWNALFLPWIQTVVRYYNGCIPGVCGAYDARFENYWDKTVDLLEELGPAFWYGEGEGCGAIPSGGATIDDEDFCFGAGGNPQYWRDEADGFGGYLLWTNATASANASNHAVWTLKLATPGDYLLEVYTDTSFAESMLAAYDVTHVGGTTSAIVDQSAIDGFQPLGVFRFSGEPGEQVRLDDNTGEPGSGMTAVVADALRVTPVQTGEDGGMTVPDAGTPLPDGGADADAGVEPPPRHGGRCSTSASRAVTAPHALLLVLALTLRARRRAPRAR